jgi:hypothetical protein
MSVNDVNAVALFASYLIKLLYSPFGFPAAASVGLPEGFNIIMR